MRAAHAEAKDNTSALAVAIQRTTWPKSACRSLSIRLIDNKICGCAAEPIAIK
jgi:hypothetical protein